MERTAILCKGPPGEGNGECTARRASTIPWLQPGKKTVFFPLAEDAAILCKGPPGEGVGECAARRASTIPRVTAGCQNCPPRNHSRESHKNKKAAAKNGCLFCRGTPTRTEDPLLPKQIR